VGTTAAHLQSRGHQVEEATLTYDYEEYLRAMVVLWSIGIDLFHDEMAAEFGRAVDERTLEPVTLAQYHWAKTLTYVDYQNAVDVINRVNRDAAHFFERYDVLITPTLSRVPQPIGYYSQNNPDLDFLEFFRRCDESMAYLPLFNMSGQPAISLPLGMSQSGLPIGVQFAGRFGDEATLLRLARAFEIAMPWKARQPAIHVSNID
ncbi:MAG: amidase family protein, partial [Chloroflexota bacterium]